MEMTYISLIYFFIFVILTSVRYLRLSIDKDNERPLPPRAYSRTLCLSLLWPLQLSVSTFKLLKRLKEDIPHALMEIFKDEPKLRSVVK